MAVDFTPEDVLSTNNIVTQPIITVIFEGIVYGKPASTPKSAALILIFKRVPHLRIYIPAIIILFILATIGLILSVVNIEHISAAYVGTLRTGDLTKLMVAAPKSLQLSAATHFVYVLANVVTDVSLIYRCYIIWGSKRRFIVAPCLVSIGSNSLGIVAVAYQFKTDLNSFLTGNDFFVGFMGSVTFTTLLLTFMMAGRVWWITRRRRNGFDSGLMKKIKATVAIMQSALVYGLFLVVYQIQNARLPMSVDLGIYPLLIQFAGISPTLIIVRAGLGLSVENSENSKQEAIFEGSGGYSQQITVETIEEKSQA
uniref:G protein-coupled receptor n=1 Tax=Moniliophthora roreri TaxID=221103 RepID=A0A0W0FDE9_MONRR